MTTALVIGSDHLQRKGPSQTPDIFEASKGTPLRTPTRIDDNMRDKL